MNAYPRRFLSVTFAFCLLAGCGEQNSAVTISPDFHRRLQAAHHLGSEDRRDKAYARIANDAADAGSGDVARKAVGLIRSETIRDRAAADTSARLMTIGQSTAAFKVAAIIKSESLRNETRAATAAGE